MKKNYLILFLTFIIKTSFCQSADEYMNLGIKYANEKDYFKSIQFFSKAIELNPLNSLNYYNRGDLKLTIGDYYGAIFDLNEAIKFAKSDEYFQRYSSYLDLGTCYLKLGEKEKACLNYSKSYQEGCEKALTAIKIYCK